MAGYLSRSYSGIEVRTFTDLHRSNNLTNKAHHLAGMMRTFPHSQIKATRRRWKRINYPWGAITRDTQPLCHRKEGDRVCLMVLYLFGSRFKL